MSTLETINSMVPSLQMSEEEFVNWSGEDASAEWVDGKVIIKTPVDKEHDQIQFWIRQVVQLFVESRKQGQVFGPQFTARLTLKDRVVRRDPDLMFVSTAKLVHLTSTMLDGTPDFVVEIVSRESEVRDYRDKFDEYQEAGVMEYWIVNPMSQQIHQFVRNATTGRFEQIEAQPAGAVRCNSIAGLELSTADVFSANRPGVFEMIKRLMPA
jgi:Uma2 family endonuclease